MTFVFLALACILAVVFVGYALMLYAPQSRPAVQLRQWRDQILRRRPPAPTVTVIQGDQEIQAPVANTGETVRVQRPHFAIPAVRSQTLAAAVGIGIGFLAITQIPHLVRSQPDSFIVLVAPFHAADGSTSVGNTTAHQLAALIEQLGGEHIVVETLDTAPATPADALATMQQENADVLISGDVAAGNSSDEPALLPVLMYHPTGTFAPSGWADYTARFALPVVYPLANTPIDNQAVLPYLVVALRDYSNGNFTASFDTLGTLANSGVLRPELPRSLRGNMLWASGDYGAAANEYRDAVALQGPVIPSAGAAMLANNLGAILQDDNNSDATTAFSRAVQLLDGKDMGELRVNLAVQALRNNTPDQAVQSLEQAQHLLPPSTALYLMLAETYRMNWQFAAADDAIQKATSQISSDKQFVLPDWGAAIESRLKADIAEEQARLQLTEVLNAHGKLYWGLLDGGTTTRPNAPSPDTFATLRKQLEQSVQQTDQLAQNWRQRAATEDANHQPVNGRIATGQAQRAAVNLREREQLLASTEIELARAQSYTPPQGLAAIWSNVSGERSPVGQARERLERMITTYPNDVEAHVDLGRVLLLNDKPDDAERQFEQVLVSGQPEPVYGQVLVVQKKDPNNTARVQQLLNEALQRNERFYPAREMLADMAAKKGDWATAIAQQQILFQQYHTPDRQLALGRVLRQSGATHAVEAERILLPLANANNPEALLELGQLYEDNYNFAAATEALNRASATAPRNPQVAFYLGKALEARGDNAAAQTQYRIAIDANPKYIDAYLALADLNQNNLPEQARLYRSAIDAGLNDPDALKRIGNALLKTANYDTAATAFQQAIKANDKDAAAHHGLAQAYLHLNDLDKATAEEQTALQLNNNAYPEAWAGLGDIALARHDANKAIEYYNTALQQNAELVDAYIGLGQAYADKLDWKDALARFQEAVNHSSCPSPANPPATRGETSEQCAKAHLWLGEALIRQNDAKGAITQYNQAITYDKNYPAAYFGLAQAQFADQQTPDALRNVNIALSQQPSYAEALLLKGKILETEGQIPAAQEAYSQAIEANGKLGEPYYRRGLLRVRNNQLNDAQDDFESAVSAQPNF
ncbi:MAG TPA: tetratricopeptide repeat protein, partial [Roseiflexaceae bacterium]|nr:tetratricopeptide repeat protein [Roseiflexaceae bacterium]